jgi:hypothetical protein
MDVLYIRFETILKKLNYKIKVEFGGSPIKLYHMFSETCVTKTRKNLGPETMVNVALQWKFKFFTLSTIKLKVVTTICFLNILFSVTNCKVLIERVLIFPDVLLGITRIIIFHSV